jgi:hypothetical protein
MKKDRKRGTPLTSNPLFPKSWVKHGEDREEREESLMLSAFPTPPYPLHIGRKTP